MDKQLEFLAEADEDITDAEYVAVFTEDGTEGGVALLIADEYRILLSESDLARMLDYVRNP